MLTFGLLHLLTSFMTPSQHCFVMAMRSAPRVPKRVCALICVVWPDVHITNAAEPSPAKKKARHMRHLQHLQHSRSLKRDPRLSFFLISLPLCIPPQRQRPVHLLLLIVHIVLILIACINCTFFAFHSLLRPLPPPSPPSCCHTHF
ncbi:hypothetical protein B0O80DRAFT_193200 [Mortierella sp. GBAus27b]|nr:hypothetical protein B0O80DRAFT_193200 [Mortierella sp. GBAus27b]